MSVVWRNEYGCIICHSTYLHRIYCDIECEQICSNCGTYKIFHVNEPFLKHGQKNYRPIDFINKNDDQHPDNATKLGDYTRKNFKIDEINILSQIFEHFMHTYYVSRGSQQLQNKCTLSDQNQSAIRNAYAVLQRTQGKLLGNFDGGNLSDKAVAVNLENQIYYIPPKCRFFNCNVQEMNKIVHPIFHKQYDLVLIDPPWHNKYVKRKNAAAAANSSSSPSFINLGYNLMDTNSIAELPISDLLSPNGLVAVWCTNSTSQIGSLLNDVFNSWNIQYLSTWYWIKVTQHGQPICKFSTEPNRKQPFERIIFASHVNREQVHKIPQPNKIIVSIPSTLHSHKPPLTDILAEYLPSNARCLEIFARYLLPDWTSCGNEVLKLQHQLLFR